MRPLRVLYLSDVYYPRVNGVSTSIATFRRALAGHAVEVTLVAPRYGAEAGEPGIRRVPGVRVPFDPEDRLVRPRALVRAAEGEFDLVHVQTPFAAHRAGVRIAAARGLPLIETWHTDFEHYFEHYLPFVPRGWARGAARRLVRRVGREADRLIAPSAALAAALGAIGLETPISVVPTGWSAEDLGAGDGVAFRARHGIAPDRPVAVYVGRLAHEKNVAFLLDVALAVRRRHPDLLLLLAGEGPARSSLKRRAEELGLAANVLFLGYLDRRTELADCYRAGDCFVFASVTETQGLVLLEAMSLGVPVVALAARGTADLLEAGEGALAPGPEVGAFAGAVARLLGDRPLRQRLAAEARALASRWSADALAGRLAAIYRQEIDRPEAVRGRHAVATARR